MNNIIKKTALLLLLTLVLAATAGAEDISVTATLDRNPISLEDEAILTISVSGARTAPAPVLPDLPDFSVASRGNSSRIQITNGAMSSQVDFNFSLVPKRAGDFTIGPVTLQYNGKTYRSEPIVLHVSKSAGVQSGGKDLFLTAEVDRASPYVGEQVVFRLKFFRRVNIAQASLGDLSFEGFQSEDLGKEVTYNTVADGVSYQVTELRKLLIPNRSGRITIPGATLQCQVPVGGKQRRQDPFFGNDLFGLGVQRTETKVLRSQPITLPVRPLPQAGKPSDFSGLVGAFQLAASLDKKEVKEGESVTLTVKLSGRGDLSGAPRPAIKGMEHFKAYDDRPVFSRKIVDDRVVSEKIFKTALVPLQTGESRIREVSLSYFDPATGNYRTASAVPPGLHVIPGTEQDKLSIVGGGSVPFKQGVSIVGKDILPIDTELQPLRDETFRPLAAVTLTLLLSPPLVFLGIFIFKRKRDRLATDIGFARSTAALKQAQKGIKEAAVLAKGTDLKKCYASLSRTFKTYLGDKLNLAGEAKTPAELKEAMQARVIQSHLLERTSALLHELEMGQFAPGTYDTEATLKLVHEVQEVIQHMEKAL